MVRPSYSAVSRTCLVYNARVGSAAHRLPDGVCAGRLADRHRGEPAGPRTAKVEVCGFSFIKFGKNTKAQTLASYSLRSARDLASDPLQIP